MLSKILSVVQSKAALAVLGVALVGGGGTAAAYAATGHQLPLMGTHAEATAKPDTTHESGDKHAHTVSIEGVLKGYSGGTISVQSKDGKTTKIAVNSKTRINGDHVSTLADLAKNIGHKVEVQADKQSNGALVAWKVTVGGADSDTSGKGNDNDKGNNTSGQAHALHNKSHVSA